MQNCVMQNCLSNAKLLILCIYSRANFKMINSEKTFCLNLLFCNIA